MGFRGVPLVGGRMASPAFCQRMAALSTAHLNALPNNAAQHLAAANCLCIADAQADSASCIAASEVPIIAALEALPSHVQAPLGELISVQRLGDATFQAVRNILAYHIPSTRELDGKVWSVLKQCSIFENADGSMTDLTQSSLLLMPNAAWEQAMLAAPQLVSNHLVKHHTASDAQQKLLKHSSLKPYALVDFLCALIHCIQMSRHPMAEPLLLQALDELADHPHKSLRYPDSLLVNGKPHRLYYMVDSSSKLLQALFQGSSDGKAALCVPASILSYACCV